MARPARRRQVGAPPAAAQSIASFTRVSKSQALPDPSAKKAAVATMTTESTASRKRKAASIDNASERHPKLTRRTVSFSPSSDDDDDNDESVESAPSKRACRREEPVAGPSRVAKPRASARAPAPALLQPPPPPTPVKGKRIAKTTPSRTATAHKPSESTVIAKSRQGSKPVQTKLDAFRDFTVQKPGCRAQEKDGGFPPHLADLVRLHRSFLKTVTIHIAHSGNNVPIDIATIAPNISRTWGKRQVTVDDIRRCIAMQTSVRDPDVVSPFFVSDYGRGKVCVELRRDRACENLSIHEERLCRQFEDNLRALCAERAQDEMSDVDVPLEGLSLSDLPQVAITNMDSGVKANPVFAKGQRALSQLKDGMVAKQQEKETKQHDAVSMLNPDGSKMSLLDRLRLKQLAKANEPLPPSGPELQRRAALNRVADVAATISMLSLSNPLSLPRQAFTMAVISEKLKDSLRVPLSKEEGMACVRLIANEVAPEWLKVVTIGGRENVVIQRNAQPVDRIIHERVQKLLA